VALSLTEASAVYQQLSRRFESSAGKCGARSFMYVARNCLLISFTPRTRGVPGTQLRKVDRTEEVTNPYVQSDAFATLLRLNPRCGSIPKREIASVRLGETEPMDRRIRT
jgi:hypothetical protein